MPDKNQGLISIARKIDRFVSILLYEVNDKYTDSIIYKKVPRYVTNTLDSLKIGKFENLKIIDVGMHQAQGKLFPTRHKPR